ncbi:hypothetical protein NRIC_28170 [Enterococcus florum]|uniref:DUF3788 domain-containing protein n=1 Tax=Enterococcus florum TaxID=2480627 RepID=A0A4P5PB53_9ENTE|nr:DUF3788 family protein [Enterococcus florum]GCF94926.1 hypothetical protein NRIC_28170 [Enterococcus florum]
MENSKRLLDKKQEPSLEQIQDFLGTAGWQLLLQLEQLLKERYDLTRTLRFPFGNQYGWSFRYAHKKTLLFYVFFERDGFCCTVSINDKGADAVEALLGTCHPKFQKLWADRYPCGERGGWLDISPETEQELQEIIQIIQIKVKPKKIYKNNAM